MSTYIDTIKSSIDSQNAVINDLDNKNNQLLKKQNVQINQLKEIEDKEKLLLTRSRMLQIAQDRNSYKKKIIYTLIATIFLIFIITIALYIFLIRKKSNINKK
jgi:predicted PurR-regulated permease PerM